LKRWGLSGKFSIFDGFLGTVVPKGEFSTPYLVVSLCHEGELRGRYDLKPYVLRRRDIHVFLPHHRFTIEAQSDDFRATILVLDYGFAVRQRRGLSLEASLRFSANPVFSFPEVEYAALCHCFDFLRFTTVSHLDDREEMAVRVLNAMFEVMMSTDEMRQMPHLRASHKGELCEQFLKLVKQFHCQSRKLGWYADRLCVSTKYLAEVVKAVSGRSAVEWINDAVVLEAKTLLRSRADLTVQEVARKMGFDDQTVFTKYFKKQTGLAPTAFRRA